jgi:hypothetical protein
MNHRLIAFVLAALAALAVSPRIVRADDGYMGGQGASLEPLVSTDVTMVAEFIDISSRAPMWDVDATYLFRNATDTPVSLQVGFPEIRCDDPSGFHCASPGLYHFESMHTTVRGVPVEMRTGEVAPANDWAAKLGTVWLFDVTFQPHETVVVRHRYEVPSGGTSDGTLTHTFLTATGSLWRGPIDVARFRFRVPATTTTLYEHLDGLTRVGSRRLAGQDAQIELTYQATDWKPTSVVSFSFRATRMPYVATTQLADLWAHGPERSGLPPTQVCPDFLSLWDAGASAADAHEPASEAAIARSTKVGGDSARVCVNTVFALYGRVFADEALNRYFYRDATPTAGTWPIGILQPNPDFDSSWLTTEDWGAIEVFRRLGAGSAVPRSTPTLARVRPVATPRASPSPPRRPSLAADLHRIAIPLTR